MKDTIQKDKRRIQAYQKYNNYHNAWKLSHRYSNMLIKHINNENLYDMCIMYYIQYMNEIKSHGYNRNKNYIQIWDTMINTVSKFEDTMKQSVRLLHQTNIQRIN